MRSASRGWDDHLSHFSRDFVGKPYRGPVGALLYVSTRNRPDIYVSVSLAARRVADSRDIDGEGAK